MVLPDSSLLICLSTHFVRFILSHISMVAFIFLLCIVFL
jgi:hypothetical protein